MKVGVVIERSNYYRLLGPVVDAALARGWDVVCLHDYAQPRSGFKGYAFPAVEAVPRFRHGAPRVVTYGGPASLPDIIGDEKFDAVVSLMPPPESVLTATRGARTAWIGLQYNAEIIRYITAPDGIAARAIGVYSRWWLEWAIQFCRTNGFGAAIRDREHEIRQRSVVVGIPELDRIPAIDAAAVRRRWGIPESRPVVLFLPYPFRSNPVTSWSRWVYRPGFRAWRRLRLNLAGAGDLVPQVVQRLDDLAIVRALRRFCDANGAHFVVKARLKDRIPRYLRSVADLALYDESNDPPTILEALAVAAVCVHFWSTTVMEAVASGVPSLSLCPTRAEMGIPETDDLFSTAEDGLYQFRGVARTMGIREALQALPRMRLADLAPDPAARAAYIAKFMGFSDGKSADRLLDLVREQVEEEART